MTNSSGGAILAECSSGICGDFSNSAGGGGVRGGLRRRRGAHHWRLHVRLNSDEPRRAGKQSLAQALASREARPRAPACWARLALGWGSKASPSQQRGGAGQLHEQRGRVRPVIVQHRALCDLDLRRRHRGEHERRQRHPGRIEWQCRRAGHLQQQHRRLRRLRDQHRALRHRPRLQLRRPLRRPGTGERELHGDWRLEVRRRAPPRMGRIVGCTAWRVQSRGSKTSGGTGSRTAAAGSGSTPTSPRWSMATTTMSFSLPRETRTAST